MVMINEVHKEIKIRKLSDFPAKEVSGHKGFLASSLIDLPSKGVTVRLLHVVPGGVGPVPAHSHPDTHFFLVLEGTLTLEIDGHNQTVPSGSCIEVPPESSHQLRCTGGTAMKVLAIKVE
jgi:mannose-6-phosphate isomerase-like protein (cupin superfamily)